MDVENAIIRLRLEGKTYAEIVKRLKIGHSTINRVIKEHNLSQRNRNNWDESLLDELNHLLASGKTDQEIADHFHITPMSAKRLRNDKTHYRRVNLGGNEPKYQIRNFYVLHKHEKDL